MKYDKYSIQSIFDYSKQLIGHSLREVVSEEKQQASRLQGQGKGGLEQMIEELFFEYPINSDPGPDFKEAGLELKGTGLYRQKSGELQIKERLVCDMIIRFPSSTIRLHEFLKTQILYTRYSQTNLWNHHTGPFLTNTRANAWNARCHQGNGNIAVQCLVHLSKLRASAPS